MQKNCFVVIAGMRSETCSIGRKLISPTFGRNYAGVRAIFQGQGRLSWGPVYAIANEWAFARGSATIPRSSDRGPAEEPSESDKEQGRPRYKIGNFSKTARRRRGKTRYASIAE